MGVILNKENDNDELSRRINADLRARTMEAMDESNELPDLAEDSEYVQNFQKTSRFGWVWIVLVVLALTALVSIIFL